MNIKITRILFAFFVLALAVVPAFAQSGKLEGTVVARKGKIVELSLLSQEGDVYTTGQTADMLKYFEEKMGKMTMNGWLGVAQIKFLPEKNGHIQVEILEEKSDMTVNGQKVDHFKIGKRMQLSWPAEIKTPTEDSEE